MSGFPDPLADLAQTLQPGAPAAPVTATPQNPVEPAPQPGGRVRSLLSNFFQGAGGAMMKHVGLPTPQEQAQQAFHNQLLTKQFQSNEQLKQAQISQIQSEMTPVELVPGMPAIPAKYAATVLAGLARADAAKQMNAASNLTKEDIAKTAAASQQSVAQTNAAGRQSVAEIEANARQNVAQTNAASKASIARMPARTSLTASAPEGAEQLTPAAQNALRESEPVHAQIQDLMSQFESMKKDNTPGKFFLDRLKYQAGMKSDIGAASDTIAQLELNRVVGAARVLKGSSRAIQALRMAMTHLPDVWKDSPALIYSKLSNINEALEGIKHDSYVYGKKGGVVPAENSSGTVRMRAPNGQEKDVPANLVEHYKAGGATVVK